MNGTSQEAGRGRDWEKEEKATARYNEEKPPRGSPEPRQETKKNLEKET